MFLAAMRDKSRKEEWERKPPTNLTADGMDAWYMMQRNREKEMKQRRQEAEQLLRGYRGPYFSDDASMAWSPRNHQRGRASFGDHLSESLVDPLTVEKRRQSTMPRIQNHFGEDCVPDGTDEQPRKKLGPERTDFLNERQHYDGTQYERADGNAFETGKSLFRDSEGTIFEEEFRTQYQGNDYNFFASGRSIFRDSEGRAEEESREPGASFDNARFIDITGSQGRLNEANRTRISIDSQEREGAPRANYQDPVRPGSFQDEHGEVPETIWRDFISPGKLKWIFTSRNGERF